jgi:hypothetical protein
MFTISLISKIYSVPLPFSEFIDIFMPLAFAIFKTMPKPIPKPPLSLLKRWLCQKILKQLYLY